MGRPRGRPREQAPEGYFTIRDAADVLGVTAQAIRNRKAKGSVPTIKRATQSGETRYYIPREWVEKQVARQAKMMELRLEDEERTDVTEEVSARLDAMSKRLDFLESLILQTLANPAQTEQTDVAAATEPESPAQESQDTLPGVPGSNDNSSTERPATSKERGRRRIDKHKVKLLREDAFLTQGELAERTGVSRASISNIEHGHSTTPRRETYFLLAEALGVAPEELVMRTGERD